MGEVVRMPKGTQVWSPTEEVDPLHPQAQVLMMVTGDVYMTLQNPTPAGEDVLDDPEPTPTGELDIVLGEPEPFRRKDRRPEVQPVVRSSWRSLFRRGAHRAGRRA